MENPYAKAREGGLSDQDLVEHLSKKDFEFKSKFNKAVESGVSPEEIFNHVIEKRKNESPKEAKDRKILEERSKVLNLPGVKQIATAGKSIAQTVASIPQAAEGLIRLTSKSPLAPKVQKEFFEKNPEPFITKGGGDLKKWMEEKSPWLKPEGGTQEFIENTAGPAAFNFISGMGPLRSVITSIGGQAAKEIAQASGAKESTQDKVKIGTELVLALGNPGGALRYTNRLLNQVERALPQGATVSSSNLIQNLTALRDNITRGVGTPQNTEIVRVIDEILNHAQTGTIYVQSLRAIQRDINQLRQNRNLFNLPGEKRTGGATRLLNNVQHEVHEATNLYGAQNPEWLAQAREADRAFGTYMQSKRASNWIQRHVKKSLLPFAAEILFVPHLAAKTVAGAAGVYGAAQAVELAYRFLASPTLRKYYLGILTNGARQNAVAMNENLEKLQKSMKKETQSSEEGK